MEGRKLSEKMEWLWEDYEGNRYWEKDGITYLIYEEEGLVKLKEVQSSKESTIYTVNTKGDEE